MAKLILDVPDVSCAHCKATIEGTLGKEPGINVVRVDLAAKKVFLDFDPNKITLEGVSTILDDEGYPVAGHAGG